MLVCTAWYGVALARTASASAPTSCSGAQQHVWQVFRNWHVQPLMRPFNALSRNESTLRATSACARAPLWPIDEPVPMILDCSTSPLSSAPPCLVLITWVVPSSRRWRCPTGRQWSRATGALKHYDETGTGCLAYARRAVQGFLLCPQPHFLG